MAISNYTELKAAVANWLHHSGVTSEIVDFIAMAESRINRDLRLREMETESNLSISASSNTASFPTGFQEPIALYIKRPGDSCREELSKYTPETLCICDDEGEPSSYSIDGDGVTFNRPFDVDTYTVTLRYLKGWDIATDTTNWLLTNHPDVYLWASCMEGMFYLRDEERAQLYERRYYKAKKEAQNQSRRNRRTNLKSDMPSNQSAFQITRGY